jgi:hypothetical protein
LEKQAIFPFRGMTCDQDFFQVLSTFPSVMVVSLRCKTCDHFSTKQGYFLKFQGRDLVTGGNSKRLQKQQLRSSPLRSLTLRSATAHAPAYRRLYSIKKVHPARVQIWAQQALRVQAPVANFNNQGFLDANSARGTLFRLSA